MKSGDIEHITGEINCVFSASTLRGTENTRVMIIDKVNQMHESLRSAYEWILEIDLVDSDMYKEAEAWLKENK